MGGADELIQGVIPGILGRAKVVISPYPFGVAGEDNLRVTSVNALPGVTLRINLRFLSRDRVIKATSLVHTPNSNRTVKSQDYALGDGFVMNVTVNAEGASPLIGQTFVMVQLIRGLTGATIVLGTLLAGPVTSTQGLGWPGSPIVTSVESGGYVRFINGATPAAGAEISETVPTGARWEVINFQGTLVTVAGGSNRLPALSFTQPGWGPFVSFNPGSGAPSSTTKFFWAQGMALATVIAAGFPMGGIPSPTLLLPGATLATFTANIAAGDQWSAAFYVVREYLDVM